MFNVYDKNKQAIFIRDIIIYDWQVDMFADEPEQVEGTVIALPAEDKVQVQPIEGGVPVIIDSDQCAVTYSLVQKIANLGSNAELQDLLLNAEARHNTAVADSKAKRGGSGKKKATKAKKAPNPFDSLFN